MRAVVMDSFGGSEVMYLGEVPDLHPGQGEVLVRVHATALNRADLLQRRGHYPPPPGASEVLGLEMAGEVIEQGVGVTNLQIGDRICALLPGGGYAEQAVIPAGMAMLLPANLSYEQGAAIPEAFLTAYLNLFELGQLKANQTVLVHAGASGVGTSAIQLVREAGAISIVTAGSDAKITRCEALGARAGFNYQQGSFLPFVMSETNGEGVDIILDFIGAPYFYDNIQSLKVGGRLIIIGTMGGAVADQIHLGQLLARRLQVIGTALRSRTVSDKIQLTKAFMAFTGEALRTGRIMPQIDRVIDWRDVVAAHEYMESNQNIGKIVLRIM